MRAQLIVALALIGTSCGGSEGDYAPTTAQSEAKFAEEVWDEAEEDGWADDAMAGDMEGYGGGGPPMEAPARAAAAAPKPAPPPALVDGKDAADKVSGAKGGGDDGGGERVREWFPESFLWQPLVETGAEGTATIDVRVPDQLTTWRVLALAHSRDGQQAGAVHTFDSRLPVYVDPVVPGWMYAGDVIDLPVQVVNTTSDPVTAGLSVEASGALSGSGLTNVQLGPQGSDVKRVELETVGAGSALVSATLPGADAAKREINVTPSGRPVRSRRGGTLGGPRNFKMKSPTTVDTTTQELTVQVFSGPLAVLQSEVDRAGTGTAQPWAAAYGFALANSLTGLSARTDADYDPDAVRRLKIVAWQRVVSHARSPNAGTAADLLMAMRGVEDHALAEELEARLVRTVVRGQRGGGDWARQNSAPIQTVIVQTAWAARTLPEDQEGPRLRASGAVERYERDIEDPYTAAVVLASGLAQGDMHDRLTKILTDAVIEREDGSHTIQPPSKARNPWGTMPTRAEMLAWTALALPEAEWRGDLVAELMTGYDAAWGFGAGPADVIALEAVMDALPGITQTVDVILTLDGRPVGRHTLDPTQPHVPAVLVAKTAGKTGAIGLSTEPAVPGLAWVATLDSWVPWTGRERMAGVEYEVNAEPMKVGRDSTVTLSLSAPSGTRLTVEQGLPAGTAVDEDALAALSGVISDATVQQDKVRFTTKSFGAGEIIEVPLVVRPAFGGTFSTAPLALARDKTADGRMFFAPLVWDVGS